MHGPEELLALLNAMHLTADPVLLAVEKQKNASVQTASPRGMQKKEEKL
jgi:hypothetical protein